MLHVLSYALPVLRLEGAAARMLVVGGTDDDPYGSLAATLVDPVRSGGAVVVVLPAWADEDHLLRLQSVRSALDTTRVAIHRTALPPLAAAWLVDQLAGLAGDPRVGAADLVRAAQELETRCVAAAWLKTVAKLRHPAPSLTLHARSWVRGGAFAAIVDDDPRVVVLRRDAAMPLPAAIPEGWQVALAAGDGDVERVERALDAAGLPAPSLRVEVDAGSCSWWGTDRLVELAFRPTVSSSHVERLVTHREVSRCVWCGEHLIDLICPFCRMRAATSVADPLGGPA
jgi:hypothetical protein